MRLFFTGPRIMGIRPGISFNANELFKQSRGRSEQMTGSFVYVVRGDHNMVKVGVSTNPNARLAQLRTGSAFPISFAYIGVTPGTGYDIEQLAHSMLDSRRCTGEWFDCPPDIAVAAIHGAAHKLGQPIQPIQPEWVDQIVKAGYGAALMPIGTPSRPKRSLLRRAGIGLLIALAAVGAFGLLCVVIALVG